MPALSGTGLTDSIAHSRVVVMVVPDHLVHAVEVSVELDYQFPARIAPCDADGGHSGLGAGVEQPEFFHGGYELGEVTREFKGLFCVVIHQKALADASPPSLAYARVFMAKHGGAGAAVVIYKLLTVHRVEPGPLGVVDIVRHAAGDVDPAAGGNTAGHVFFPSSHSSLLFVSNM